MGAAYSRQRVSTTNSTTNNTVSNTVIDNSSECSAQAFSNQNVTIVSIKNSTIGSITIDAKSQISSQCLQTADSGGSLSATLNNDLKSDVTQAVKQTGLVIGASVSDAEQEQINTIVNNFTQNFSVTSLSSCIATVTNNQNLNIGTVDSSNIGSINLAIDQSVILNCVQKNAAKVAMDTAVSNLISAKAEQTASQGIDIGSLFIILIVIIAVVFLIYKGGIDVVTKPQVILPIFGIIALLIGIRFL